MFGERLRIKREAAGITLQGMAEACGVDSYQTIQKWERNEHPPKVEYWESIARKIGVDVYFFVEDIGFFSEKKNESKATYIPISKNKNLANISAWIGEQEDTDEYWAWINIEMKMKFPDYAEWLKKGAGILIRMESTPAYRRRAEI